MRARLIGAEDHLVEQARVAAGVAQELGRRAGRGSGRFDERGDRALVESGEVDAHKRSAQPQLREEIDRRPDGFGAGDEADATGIGEAAEDGQRGGVDEVAVVELDDGHCVLARRREGAGEGRQRRPGCDLAVGAGLGEEDLEDAELAVAQQLGTAQAMHRGVGLEMVECPIHHGGASDARGADDETPAAVGVDERVPHRRDLVCVAESATLRGWDRNRHVRFFRCRRSPARGSRGQHTAVCLADARADPPGTALGGSDSQAVGRGPLTTAKLGMWGHCNRISRSPQSTRPPVDHLGELLVGHFTRT